MNKQFKRLFFVTMAMCLICNANASQDAAPEIDLSGVTGSVQDFEDTVPALTSAYYTVAPKNRQDGLRVGDMPQQHDLMVLGKAIAEGKFGPFDSLLISYQDRLVFESYFNKGRINLPHYQASASKGYTAFAIGRAIQLGFLSMQDLHKPILAFLSDVDRKNLVPGIEKITLHHTLSMRSGLRINPDIQRELAKQPEKLKGQKLAQAYFTHSDPVNYDTQTYKYQSMDTRLSMLVLDAVVPGSARDFIKTELLKKLGIENYYWKENISGVPEAAYGISMTSRDMIKWARLLEQNGTWQGEQLVSEAFLTQATGSLATPNSKTFDFSDFRYGYYFWGTKIKVGERTYDAKMAWGGGGQYAMAVDELDLAIAITARVSMQEDKTFEILKNHLLPTFENIHVNSAEFPALTGPYLGQKPPGLTAEPFAPGIISREGWELEGVFAPGMTEFYFTTRGGKRKRPTVIGFRQHNNVWNKFMEFTRDGEVTFSPDGKRMHMAEGYKDRIANGWSKRESLGPMFERDDWGIMRLSASAQGTYVFDDYKGGDVIRISKIKNGKRQTPRPIGPEINTGKWTAHPFIAADESYLIWDSERPDGFGGSDLYISFKQTDGTWGPAINMGKQVNSSGWDAYASVTPDGKYMLFNRGIDEDNDNVDIYWVDAKIIDELKVKAGQVAQID